MICLHSILEGYDLVVPGPGTWYYMNCPCEVYLVFTPACGCLNSILYETVRTDDAAGRLCFTTRT